MKREPPMPVRLCEIYRERLAKQAKKKGISTHKHVVQTLIKQSLKPI